MVMSFGTSRVPRAGWYRSTSADSGKERDVLGERHRHG